jgi:simple sugar transport system ATP-binding protein
MDEPTSVLTPQEVAILFATLRKLREEGTAILYISHKLEEIRALCEEATILRGGRVVGTCDPRAATARQMAEMMVGGTLKVPARAASPGGEVVLEVSGLSAPSPNLHGMALKGVSFEVRRGEVLGIGGVAGNGQDELLLALSGELRTAPGWCGCGPSRRALPPVRAARARPPLRARRSGWATRRLPT